MLTAEPAQVIGIISGYRSSIRLKIRQMDARDAVGDAGFVVWPRRRKSHNAACDFFAVAVIRQNAHQLLHPRRLEIESKLELPTCSPRSRRFIEPGLAVEHGR